MSPGMHPIPHPDDPPEHQAGQVPDVPEEEHLDLGRVEEDLEQEPDEK